MPKTEWKLFDLPSAGEIISRLTNEYDDGCFRSYYLEIANHAGSRLSVTEVINLTVTQAEKWLLHEKPDTVHFYLLCDWLPKWVRALVGDKTMFLGDIGLTKPLDL